jgi:hypothetical protein
MALRDDIQKRIDKKRTEIAALEAQINSATIYIQALEDTLKMIPREADTGEVTTAATIRPGSKMDKAREAIRKVGKPLYISALVESIGEPNTAARRAALAGSLSAYARRGDVFTRPAPNTFGLIELTSKRAAGPPANFGLDEEIVVIEDPEEADLEDIKKLLEGA